MNNHFHSPPLAQPFYHRPIFLNILAFFTGLAYTFCFAPTPFGGWLQLIFITLFITLVSLSTSWKKASFTGLAFGFGSFVSGISWIYISIHDYGGMNVFVAILAVCALALYLAIFPAFAAGLWRFLSPKSSKKIALSWFSIITFASTWYLSEWLKGSLFTGFPWLSLGYAQTDGPFAGYAPILGVYGVGWITMLCCGFIVKSVMEMIHFSKSHSRHFFSSIIIVISLISSGIALSFVEWTTSLSDPISVRLVQGNISQSMKIHQQQSQQTLAYYQQLITAQPSDLIITPETALPYLSDELPDSFLITIKQFVKNTQSSLLFGIVRIDFNPQSQKASYSNSALGISPQTDTLYQYDKHHLVPFGEYVPKGFQWFIDLLKIPLGSFTAGKRVQEPFFVKGQAIAPDICYEDLFGEQIAQSIRENKQEPNILVNMTNLGWFGHSLALPQHLQIARMRSLETGRPMLTVTNNGITAIITPKGKVIGQLAPFTAGSLERSISGYSGFTPYVLNGNITMIIIVLFILVIAFAIQPLKRKRATKPKTFI